MIYWYSYLSRVYLPASTVSVCSLRVLEEEEPHVVVEIWTMLMF